MSYNSIKKRLKLNLLQFLQVQEVLLLKLPSRETSSTDRFPSTCWPPSLIYLQNHTPRSSTLTCWPLTQRFVQHPPQLLYMQVWHMSLFFPFTTTTSSTQLPISRRDPHMSQVLLKVSSCAWSWDLHTLASLSWKNSLFGLDQSKRIPKKVFKLFLSSVLAPFRSQTQPKEETELHRILQTNLRFSLEEDTRRRIGCLGDLVRGSDTLPPCRVCSAT